jgi:NAD(P)-dependent dehydrogenase (short-subunit alcohol dehydrogenase family)
MTGASSGTGAAFAEALPSTRDSLLTSRNEEKLAEVAPAPFLWPQRLATCGIGVMVRIIAGTIAEGAKSQARTHLSDCG